MLLLMVVRQLDSRHPAAQAEQHQRVATLHLRVEGRREGRAIGPRPCQRRHLTIQILCDEVKVSRPGGGSSERRLCRTKRKNQLRPLAVKGRLERRALGLPRLTINVFCDVSEEEPFRQGRGGGGAGEGEDRRVREKEMRPASAGGSTGVHNLLSSATAASVSTQCFAL